MSHQDPEIEGSETEALYRAKPVYDWLRERVESYFNHYSDRPRNRTTLSFAFTNTEPTEPDKLVVRDVFPGMLHVMLIDRELGQHEVYNLDDRGQIHRFTTDSDFGFDFLVHPGTVALLEAAEVSAQEALPPSFSRQ